MKIDEFITHSGATKQEQRIAPQSRQIPLKLRGKSEQDVAKGMKEKGYNYILIFLDSDIEPLYTKTIEQASKLMREDYKNEHFDITTIDKFLNRQGSRKLVGDSFDRPIEVGHSDADTYMIKNTSGQFWTGAVWGVEQAAEEYGLQDLPLIIEDLEIEGDGTDTTWVDPEEPEKPVASLVKSTRYHSSKLEGALKKLGDESTKKQAAKMPGLFNSDYKKWLQMEAKILAMNAGTASSQEEAELLMDKSIDKLVDMVADSVENEIYDVVDEVREDIIEEMIKKMQAQEVPVEALPEIEEPEAEISEPAVQAKPIAIPGSSLDKTITKL